MADNKQPGSPSNDAPTNDPDVPRREGGATDGYGRSTTGADRGAAQRGESSEAGATGPPRPRLDSRSGEETDEHPTQSGADSLRREVVVRGTHPGDRYLRVDRNFGPFRRKAGGILSASLETDEARSGFGRAFNRFKRAVIGRPISSELSIHERLTKAKALAVLSSDPLSSVAYATEEILRVLVIAGIGVVSIFTMPVGIAVMLLLAIVAISYRQTIAAYPRGGGSYIVAKDNLGTLPGLTAAASILIDYTMTVAVSVSAGVDAIISLNHDLYRWKVDICLVIIIFVTLANLRGVREAGNIFAVPTYLFIFGILAMIAVGVFRWSSGTLVYLPAQEVITVGTGVQQFGVLLLLRAFSQGCTALTGVEAIADGVPAFKPPEYKNARSTLVWMASIAITMFAGLTFLATQMKVLPSDKETVLSQVARSVFHVGPDWFSGGAWFYINIATALILVLAANTAFSDFPRLAYFLARDKFLPHQYSFRGDRLAFSWGIVTLATLACVLILLFGGNVTALIPLYTVGVFNSFTLSQFGMVVRWWRLRTPGWQGSLAMNGFGALATFAVLLVSAYTKFLLGAWIVIALIPLIILLFLAIHRHYMRFEVEVEPTMPVLASAYRHTVIVPIAKLNPVALSALAYARSLHERVFAVHIAEGEDPEEAERFNDEWKRSVHDPDVKLVIIESPYRSLVGPLLSFIDTLDQQNPGDTITIVVPELLPSRPWEYLLHGQSALRLKAALLFRPNTVVANIPYVTGQLRTTPAQAARGVLSQFPWAPVLVSAAIGALAYIFLFPHR